MSHTNGHLDPQRNGRAPTGAGEGFPSFDAVYAELKAMASRRLGRDAGRLEFQTTSLVHEALVKLLGPAASWDSKAHFFGAAARAMQQILVDDARRRKVRKRSGRRTTLAGVADGGTERDPADTIALHEALTELEQYDREAAEIVRLHHYGGLGFNEIARVIDKPVRTTRAHWKHASAWLLRRIAGASPP